jgi:hypothetical protein
MRRTKISGGADYIVPGALVIGGGFLLYSLFKGGGFLSNLFQTAGGANNLATDTSTAAGQAATAKALAAQGVNPTLTDTQLSQIANTVFSLGTQDPPDVGGINNQISQINNIADLNKIIGYFGTRAVNQSMSYFSACYALGYNCQQMGLAQFINLLYAGDNADYLVTLNGFLSDMKINYQF